MSFWGPTGGYGDVAAGESGHGDFPTDARGCTSYHPGFLPFFLRFSFLFRLMVINVLAGNNDNGVID